MTEPRVEDEPGPDVSPREWVLFGVGVLAAWVVLLCRGGGVIYLDDALICLRVIDNALAGHGFVFNVGESGMVYSNPGFILSATGIAALGFGPERAVALIHLLVSMTIPASLGLLLRGAAPMVLGAVVSIPLFRQEGMWHSCKGMETALLMAVSFGAFALLRCGWIRSGAALAGFAALCRPDALVVPVIYAGVCFATLDSALPLRDRARRLLPVAAIIAAVGGAWAVLSLAMHGSVLPLTVKAKSIHMMMMSPSLVGELKHHLAQAPLLILLAFSVVGAAWLLCSRPRWQVLAMLGWGLVNLLLLLVGNAPHFHWYFVPALTSVLCLAAVGVWGAWEWLAGGRHRFFAQCALLVAAFAYAVPAMNVPNWGGLINPGVAAGKKASATFIADHAEPGDIVASDDVGFVGRYSGLYVLDTAGLLHERTHPWMRSANYAGLMEEVRPRWLFGGHSARSGELLALNYELRASPSNYSVYSLRNWDIERVLRTSPGLLDAVGAGLTVVLVDFPTIAVPPAELERAWKAALPGARPPALAESGAVEALAGRDRLAIFRPDVASLQFARDSNMERLLLTAGASPFPSLPLETYQIGMARAESGEFAMTSADPRLEWRDAPLPPGTGYVLVAYKFSGERPARRSGRVYFATESAPGLSEEKSIGTHLHDDGLQHLAVFDLTRAPEPPGPGARITSLRFDPVEAYPPLVIEQLQILLAPVPGP